MKKTMKKCVWCDRDIEMGYYCVFCQKLFDDMEDELRRLP